MQTGRIITREAPGQYAIWATFTDKISFLNFMQYLIDSSEKPERFILQNVENGLCYDAYRIATELYHIRKRTFDERLNDVKTYSI